MPGRDLINLRSLLAALSYTGLDPFADGWLSLVNVGSGVELRGLRGNVRTLRLPVTLAGVTAEQIDAKREVIVR